MLNPIWANIVGAAYPDLREVQQILWEAASLPVTEWPEDYRRDYERLDWIDGHGRVHVCRKPEEIFVLTAGGLGGLHATVLHSWGTTVAQTRSVKPVNPS